MRLITDKNIANTLFAQIQSNALAKGNCHWDGYKSWCIKGEEIEQALKDIFAEDDFLKTTIDIVQCKECRLLRQDLRYCSLTGMPVADDDFCSYGEKEQNTCHMTSEQEGE